ncbi:RNA polymerase sigma factor [Thermomonas sp.]
MSLSQKADHALLEAAKNGDVIALAEVLANSRQDLQRYAEYHCVVNDVEDAVQESMILVFNRLGDLRKPEAFASWLFRIVKRECNRMRRGWRLLTNQEIDESIQPLSFREPNELRMDIARVLQELPNHYRTILLMRDVEGLSLNETAEHLGLELAATKSRLHRARMLARELLDDGTGPGPKSE